MAEEKWDFAGSAATPEDLRQAALESVNSCLDEMTLAGNFANGAGYGADRGVASYEDAGNATRAALRGFARGVAAISYALIYAADARERARRGDLY